MPTNHNTQHETEERFLTVAEIAERLQVNEQTVRNWIDRGMLRAVRVGPRRIRVLAGELDRFLAAYDIAHGKRRAKTTRAGCSAEARMAAVSASTHGESERVARDGFLTSSLELVRIVLADGAPPQLARALRRMARAAESWASALE